MKLPALPPSLHKNLVATRQFFTKRHYFIVIIIILICLSVVVSMVNQTLQLATDDQYRDQKASTGVTAKFDQATINKIERLQRSNEQPAALAPPSGARTNPFAE